MPTFREAKRATTKGKEQRPWVRADKVKHPQFLPHLQFFRWVHLKNNPGKGKAVRPYQQSVADARLLRTAIRDRLSHWGNGDAPAGGWGADLLVDAPGWTKQFLAEVEPVEGEALPEDDDDGDDGDEGEGEDYMEEAGDEGILHGWGHEEREEAELDEGASVGGGGSVALSALRPAEIAKRHEEKGKMLDDLLESAEFKALSPAEQAKRLLSYEALEEAWEGVAPARYEKGKERQVFDKKLATAVMAKKVPVKEEEMTVEMKKTGKKYVKYEEVWPMPKEGETSKSPAYRARLEAFLALPNPIPGYTAQDAERERLLPGGVKAINFISGGGKKSNEMLRREDETPAEFAVRQRALKVAWGGAKATGAYKGESQAKYIERIKAGWRPKNEGESDADFIKAFEEAKGSTTITYPQGVGNLKQFLYNQTDAEASADYYLDLERGKRDLQRGKSTRYGEKVRPDETQAQFQERKKVSKTDLRSSHFPFVGKNPFEELKEGRGDLAYDVGRLEGGKLVGTTKVPVGSKYLLTKRTEHPWTEFEEEEFAKKPLSPPVRRKNKEGKTEYYVGGKWTTQSPLQFNVNIKQNLVKEFQHHIDELDKAIEAYETAGENGNGVGYEDELAKVKALKAIYEDPAYMEKINALRGRTTVLKMKPPAEAPSGGGGGGGEAKEPEAEDAEAGELVDLLAEDDEKVYNAYQAHLASQSKPVEGEKPQFFERLNELMNRHAMGLEDVSAGLERLRDYRAGGKVGKQPMEHAFADPARPGSLAKLKVAKGATDDGVGLVSNREGAKKLTTTMAKEGQIEGNPNKGLAKAGQRGKLMWRPPTVKGEHPAEAVEVPEGEIFPVRLSSSEKFKQGDKSFDQWKTFTDGEGHLPATARAFIDPVNKDMMRIYAFDPPREIAQGEKDPEDPTGWRVRKIDPQFLPAVKGGSMKIEPGRPVGRPYRDIDARLATLTEEREAMIDKWATYPEWLRSAFPGRYAPTMEGRVIGGGFGEGQEAKEGEREGQHIGGRWHGAEGGNALGMFPGQQSSHFTKPAYGGAGLYKQAHSNYYGIGQRQGRAGQLGNPPQFNPAFLAKKGMTQEEVDGMFQEMKAIYFRDEDIGSEFDRLKLTGDSRGSLGGEAWGRATGRDFYGRPQEQARAEERGKKATLAELRGKPLRERAEALSELTEEEKAGKTPAQIDEAQRSKTARVLRELQKRGLLPPPGATRAEGVGGDMEWATSRALGINEALITKDIIKKKAEEWLKANPTKRHTPFDVDRQHEAEAKAEAQAIVAQRKADLRKGEGLAFPPPLKKKAEAPKAGGGGGGGGAEAPKVYGGADKMDAHYHPWAEGVAPKDKQRAEDAWREANPSPQHSRPVFDKKGGKLSDAQVRVSRDGRWERFDFADGDKRAWQDAFSSYETGGGYDHIYDLIGEDKKNGLELGKKYKDLMSSPHDPDGGQWWLERVFTSDRPVPNMERVGGEAIIWVCEMEADGAGGATKVCKALPWCNPTLVKRIEEHNAKLPKGKPKARLPSEYREE